MRAFKTLLLVVMLCGAVSAATVLSIQPSTTTVSPGQTFTLDVSVSGAVDLYGYQFDVGFDPLILAANSVSEGPFLQGAGATVFFPGSIDNVGGTISFNAASLTGLVPGASGTGTLATLSFTSLGAGSSSVGLFNLLAFDSFGEGIELGTSGGRVDVSGVPEPGSALLSSLGLLALTLHTLFWRRRPWRSGNWTAAGHTHPCEVRDVCSGDLRERRIARTRQIAVEHRPVRGGLLPDCANGEGRAFFSGSHADPAGRFGLGGPAQDPAALG